jgi:hypothetical protein
MEIHASAVIVPPNLRQRATKAGIDPTETCVGSEFCAGTALERTASMATKLDYPADVSRSIEATSRHSKRC